jgi:two-component system OmpR family sensor kinase
MRRLSLRARLVLGVLVLATVGLVTADLVTYTSLRSFLLQRVDAALEADHAGFAGNRGAPRGPGGGPYGPMPPGVSQFGNDYYVAIRSPTGKLLASSPLPHDYGTPAPPGPRLPATITLPARANDGPDRARFFTVPALSGGGSWRVRASIDPGSDELLIFATPLSSEAGTLHRLLLIELFVTLGVLAGIVVLGLTLVRLGLRPLVAIGATADLISAGDLSHRVERAEPRTEVGRLGLALNTMLDRIEASDSRLRRFVADASHELRTPLAAVRAYAELFGRGADRRPEDLARAMSGISRESERMSVLVDDLLLLARLDEGLPLEREPVALDEVAAEAVETARMVDPERELALELEPLVVLGDRVRLRQALDNLLGNVRAHTAAGTPARVRLARLDGAALVEVSDAGAGFPAGEAERVFERFYRPDTHRSRASGGAGLGLSIVAAIAAAHGGSVTASSPPEGGARFTISLPLLDAQRTAAASPR